MHLLKFTGNMSQSTFEATCSQHSPWYHSFYFDNGYSVKGDYNIGLDIGDYGFPSDMSGMKVLDIGTGAGWFSFFFEQAGAQVTTVDARGYSDFDVYGRYKYPPIETEKQTPDRWDEAGQPIYHSPVSKAFWIMREALGSKVNFVNARVYEICPELFDNQQFDLVFMGALLLHLRDPIGALMAARSVCSGQLVATTRTMPEHDDNPFPFMDLPFTSIDKISWWRPNKACFKHWLLAAGFSSVDVESSVSMTGDVLRPGKAIDPTVAESPNISAYKNDTHQLRLGRALV